MSARVLDRIAEIADHFGAGLGGRESRPAARGHRQADEGGRVDPAAAAQEVRRPGGAPPRVRRDGDGHGGAGSGGRAGSTASSACIPTSWPTRTRGSPKRYGRDDVDTWMASPYAPQGVARPVDGGYVFNGRWQFSSGTDACDWIILGAMIGDADGKPLMPPQMLHMILPRKDYEIVRRLLECGGAAGNRLQGRHRQGRLRPVLPHDGRDEGDGRHRPARGRNDRDAVPDAVVDDVPAGHLIGGDRHRRGRAGRASGLPARTGRRQLALPSRTIRT